MQINPESETQNCNMYRWRIVALLFFATTFNYIDRQVIGILAPVLEKELGWSELDYGTIITAFQIAYALGLLFVGKIIDNVGVRIGYAIAIVVWSVAGMFHAAARTVFAFASARFTLALGESANFPAAIKAVAEWFPRKERALATGIFNSGSSVGAIVAPLMVPFLAVNYGWQWAFIVTGAIGLIWLIFWLPIYRIPQEHPRVSPEELSHICSSDECAETTERISWKQLLMARETWIICLIRFMTDPVWWFLLYWLPKFLFKQFGVDMQHLGLPLIVVYMAASFGGIFGGWLSSKLISMGKSIDVSRKLTFIIAACFVIPLFFCTQTHSVWVAITLISMATAGHGAYSSIIFTVVSDMYPKKTVASMTGLSSFAAAIGGILFSVVVGLILEKTGNYYLIFAYASSAYLLAWIIMRLFIPKIETIKKFTV